MIYDKWLKSWNEADVAAYKTLHHDDWGFKFHSTGNIMRTGDMSDEQLEGMMKNHVNDNMRCIYENNDILVVHSFATFPSGDTGGCTNGTSKEGWSSLENRNWSNTD